MNDYGRVKIAVELRDEMRVDVIPVIARITRKCSMVFEIRRLTFWGEWMGVFDDVTLQKRWYEGIKKEVACNGYEIKSR